MPPALTTKERYKRLPLSELQDLAAEGSESFTPEAWRALLEEIEARGDRTPPETASTPDRPDASSSPTTPSVNPFARDGVWLTVFQAMIAIGTIWVAGIAVLSALSNGPDFGTIFGALAVSLNILGLVLIAQRRPFARRFWIAYLGVGAVLSIVSPLRREALGLSTVVRFAISIAWAMYWLRSERVRLGFGELDEVLHSGE